MRHGPAFVRKGGLLPRFMIPKFFNASLVESWHECSPFHDWIAQRVRRPGMRDECRCSVGISRARCRTPFRKVGQDWQVVTVLEHRGGVQHAGWLRTKTFCIE